MDASELTAWLMTVLTQASNGAVGAVGGAAGAEASRLMRERLGATAEGRAALDPESGDPDEAARQVSAALTADPVFARRLEQLHDAALRQPTAAPYAGRDMYHASVGDRAKNNTISFGPLTLRKDRAPLTVTVLLLVAVLVLGFAVYGIVQATDGDDRAQAPGASSGTAGGASDDYVPDIPLVGGKGGAGGDGAGSGGKAAPVKDLQRAKAILPDLQSVPSGWSAAESPQVQEVTADNCQGTCGGLLSEGEVTYAVSGTSDRADVEVEAYDSVSAANTGYTRRVDSMGSGEGVASMSLEEIGDESAAFSQQEYTGSEHKYAMGAVVRSGTVVIRVSYGGGYDRVDPAVVSGLARTVAERARQAQNGEEPTAGFSGAP